MKEKLKELTKDTAIYGISTILSRFLNFILVPFYTNVFTTSEYGIITTVYAYVAFFNIIYLYGMDAAYLKFYASRNEKNSKEIFSTPFLFVAFSSLLFSAFLILFSSQMNYLFSLPKDNVEILFYVILILFFDAVSVIPFGYLRLIRKAKKFALIKSINIVTNVVLNIILVLIFRMNIEAVFISNLAASILTFILLLPDIFANLKININSGILKDMLKFGIPYLPAGFASMIIQVINRPILLAMTNESTVGIFQANYRLGIFMMLFVSMFQYAWQPFFLTNAKEKNAKEIFSKVLTYFVLASSIILVLITLFINDFVKIEIFNHRTIIGSKFWSGLDIVPIILLAFMIDGIYVNFTAGIFIESKTKYTPFVTGAGALANIIFNLLLIPVVGMIGAALATLISYSVMALSLYIITQKFYKIKYEYRKLLNIFIVLTITALFFYFLAENNFLYKIILFLFFISLLFIFKIIKLDEMKNLKFLFSKKSINSENNFATDVEEVIK